MLLKSTKDIELSKVTVLMTADAIVSRGWLSASRKAVSREDVVAAMPRNIVQPSCRDALLAVPYAQAPNDIDIALDATSNQLVNPAFDEHLSLSSVERASPTCTLFKSMLFQKIDLNELAGLGDTSWFDAISKEIRTHMNSSIVYTPDSKIFNSKYFYT